MSGLLSCHPFSQTQKAISVYMFHSCTCLNRKCAPALQGYAKAVHIKLRAMRMVPLQSGCRDRNLQANMLQKMKTHLEGACVLCRLTKCSRAAERNQGEWHLAELHELMGRSEQGLSCSAVSHYGPPATVQKRLKKFVRGLSNT